MEERKPRRERENTEIAPSPIAGEVAWLERFARMLDSAVAVPGTNFRFGLDALIGLVPGVGDSLGAALSGYFIYRAALLGATPLTLFRMAGNVIIDMVVGAVPLVGDIFDFGWKANIRNYALLQATIGSPAARPRSPGQVAGTVKHTLIAIAVLLIVALATISWLVIKLLSALLQA